MDGGCSTVDGQVEKKINLNIVLSAKTLAEFFGYEVVATRLTDKSIHDQGVTGIRNQKISDMDNRLEVFNARTNAVCVSVHQNTFSDPKYKGAQMFYSENIQQNEVLASIMQQKFVANLQPDNVRETKPCGEELFLCHFSKNPSIMIECGFLSNPEESAQLTDEKYQSRVAFTIFSGLNEFINGVAA